MNLAKLHYDHLITYLDILFRWFLNQNVMNLIQIKELRPALASICSLHLAILNFLYWNSCASSLKKGFLKARVGPKTLTWITSHLKKQSIQHVWKYGGHIQSKSVPIQQLQCTKESIIVIIVSAWLSTHNLSQVSQIHRKIQPESLSKK